MGNQIGHVLIGRHFSMVDVRRFRWADCDIDHFLVTAEVRERLSVSQQAAQMSDIKRFNPRKLNYMEVKERYQVKILNRFAAS
jgi:hypothetical protein